MIEYISNMFNITNVMTNLIWIAIGAFLQFVISKTLNKLKIRFSYNEYKIIRKLSEDEKFILLKEEYQLAPCSNKILENLEALGILRITYLDINIMDASGTVLLYKTQDKSNPHVELTDIGVKIKHILNKDKEKK